MLSTSWEPCKCLNDALIRIDDIWNGMDQFQRGQRPISVIRTDKEINDEWDFSNLDYCEPTAHAIKRTTGIYKRPYLDITIFANDELYIDQLGLVKINGEHCIIYNRSLGCVRLCNDLASALSLSNQWFPVSDKQFGTPQSLYDVWGCIWDMDHGSNDIDYDDPRNIDDTPLEIRFMSRHVSPIGLRSDDFEDELKRTDFPNDYGLDEDEEYQ